MKKYIILATLAVSATAFSADLQWNGFASVYGRKSLEDTYDKSSYGKTTDFSSNTKVGLNVRSDFTNNWAAVGQLVVSQRSVAGDTAGQPPQWTPEFDWFYLTYDVSEKVSIKAGRQLLPGVLVAEYTDVGLAYPWRRVPVEFQTIALFKFFEGVSITHSTSVYDLKLTSKIFGGDSHPHIESGTDGVLYVNDLIGGSATLSGDGWLGQVVAYQAHPILVQRTYSGGVGTTTGTAAFGETTQSLFVGLKYDKNNFVGYAEHAWATSDTKSYAYTATAGYRFQDFLPYYTYTHSDWNAVGNFGGGITQDFIVGVQDSHILGLNYQIDPAVVLKSEFLWQRAQHGSVLLSQEGIARSAAIGVDVVF